MYQLATVNITDWNIEKEHLTFTYHIYQIVARAFMQAHLIHKRFVSRDTASLTHAFVVYVRPLLE